MGLEVTGTTTFDLLIESATGLFRAAGCRLREDRVSIAAGAATQATFFSDTPGDEGQITWGQTAVGRRGAGSEAAFGEGDSGVIGMHVFTNDNLAVGTWTDETAAASSSSGSTFTLFPGVAAGNACYFGQEDFTFTSLKTTVSSTAIALGAGALVWEYWNGAAWVAFSVLATDADAPLGQYAQAVFGRPDQADQIRWNTLAGHASSTLNGQAAFWVRVRVSVGITTSPVIEQIKIGTNRTEINATGTVEFFGTAIQTRPLAVSSRFALSGGGSPGNVTLNPSANIAWVDADAGYVNAGDGVVYVVQVPQGLDTSRPLQITVQWKPSSTGAAPVTMTLYATTIQAGDLVPAAGGALVEVSDPRVYTASGTADGVEPTVAHRLSLPDVIPGEVMVLSLQRTTASGGGTPSVELIGDPLIEGCFWH